MFNILKRTRAQAAGRIPASVKTGQWTKVHPTTLIGERVRLGNWSSVGPGSDIAEDCIFGDWARTGRRVTLGRGVRLGSHTIIQDDVSVPAGTVFEDHDLVTPDGVIANRTGGSITSLFDGIYQITTVSGVYLVREEAYDRSLLEDFQWGRSDDLEDCRVPRLPATQEEREMMLRDAEAACRRARFRVVTPEGDDLGPGL
ncbi:LbetaH domain-containing protein [Leisingera caerulea]|uniref:hypothetical protein n=1 Tax=Leisingera caerulea TaxID=506591 RepID=UPI0004888FA9|nr:hypothetical protein [Leisingera caerulea]